MIPACKGLQQCVMFIADSGIESSKVSVYCASLSCVLGRNKTLIVFWLAYVFVLLVGHPYVQLLHLLLMHVLDYTLTKLYCA